MRIRDEETTLDPTLYRNYSSRLGRWLTAIARARR